MSKTFLRIFVLLNHISLTCCVIAKIFLTVNPGIVAWILSIPVSGATVSWYEQSQDAGWLDSYTVYVGETAVAQAYNESTAPNGMKVLYADHEVANPWTQISVELSAENYGGKTVYIAFRHKSEDCYFLEIDDFAVRAVAPAHTHAFTYTANDNKITATCTEGCDQHYDTNPLTLTLTAPSSLVYDRNVKAFTFADGEADAWTGAGLELPTIYYQIKQSGQSTYMPLLGTLKDAGSYMAQITVDGKAAQVEFAIDKATLDLQIGDKEYYGITRNQTIEVKSLDDIKHIKVLVQNGTDIEGMSDNWSMSTDYLDGEGRGVLEVQVFEEGDDYVIFNLVSHYADCSNANVEDFQVMMITAKLPAPDKFTVTFNMNGHGTEIAKQEIESGNKATKPADPTSPQTGDTSNMFLP